MTASAAPPSKRRWAPLRCHAGLAHHEGDEAADVLGCGDPPRRVRHGRVEDERSTLAQSVAMPSRRRALGEALDDLGRGDDPRAHAVHRDAGAREMLGQTHRDRRERALGRVVLGNPIARPGRTHGRDEHHPPPAGRPHVGEERLGDAHRAHHVGVVAAVPTLRVGRIPVAPVRDAVVVDHDVDRASTAPRTAATSAAVPCSVRMSPTTAWHRPPASVISRTMPSACPGSRPCTRTVAPSAARTRAMPAPVPRYEPVTSATFPPRPSSMSSPSPSRSNHFSKDERHYIPRVSRLDESEVEPSRRGPRTLQESRQQSASARSARQISSSSSIPSSPTRCVRKVRRIGCRLSKAATQSSGNP